MEYEAPQDTKCFKNAALRREFLNNVIAAFEAAQGHTELICLYENFRYTFTKMEGDDTDYDQMTLNIINARYQGYHARIDEQEDRMKRLLIEHEERELKF